jgi:hypothetical protein
MSQHDLDIANQGFPATRADINNALKALGSSNSGATAPSTTYANQLWYDTANNIIKIRNEDNDAWISLFTLDQTNDNIEALTVDGTVTVGTTDTTPIGSGGIALRNEGRIDVSRASGVAANIERRTDNGALVQFYKDGVVVGQILSSDNSRIKLSLGGNNNAGITGGTGDDVILPTLNHSTSDNTVDIGSSGVRFNSMYLGGNLYLGGTDSAHALSHYEEGNWTPGFTFGGSAAGVAYSVQEGKFTRIGRQVTCMFDVRLTSNGSGSGAALLTGLPFSVGNLLTTTALEGGGVFTLHQSQGTAHTYASIIPDDSSTSAQMYADLDTVITNVHIGNSSTIRGVFTYFTA